MWATASPFPSLQSEFTFDFNGDAEVKRSDRNAIAKPEARAISSDHGGHLPFEQSIPHAPIAQKRPEEATKVVSLYLRCMCAVF